MELFRENGNLVGRASAKDLEWMSDVQIPMIALGRMLSEIKDDHTLGRTFRLLGEACMLVKMQMGYKYEWTSLASLLVSEGLPDDAVIGIIDILRENNMFDYIEGRSSKNACKKFVRMRRIPDDLRNNMLEAWEAFEKTLEDTNEER